MSLRKQNVAIPLAQGIDTKIDANQRPLGTLENLENALFDKPGKIKKRNGYEQLNTLLVDDSEITDAQRITTYQNELCMFNQTNLYSYSSSTDRWSNKGTVSNIFPATKSVIRNSYQQSNIDSAHINGLNVYAWQDSRNGVRVSIIDESTGNAILSDTQITATGEKPKVESKGNVIYFLYVDGTDLKYRTVNPLQPNIINAEVTIVSSDINASKIYDTASSNSQIFYVWRSNTNTLKVQAILEDDTLSALVQEASEDPSVCIDLNIDQLSRLSISYYNGTEVKVILKSLNLLANILSATVIETIANITNVTTQTSNSIDYTVLYEQSSANTYDYKIRKNTVTSAGVVASAQDYILSCALASKQFTYNNNMYVAVIHESALQSTVFILNENAEVVSKINQNLSGTIIDSGSLPKVSTISPDTYLLATQIKGRTISEDNTLFSLLGVSRTILDFTSETRYDNALLGQQLHTNGGLIQSYDGKEIVEHGFNLFPENLSNAATASTGGNMSDGNYQYSAIYTWTDNKGQLHRSAPSIGFSVTLSAGTSTQTQTITVPTLRITEKSNVTIELYRTEAAGTVFYKVSSIASPDYNDSTVNSVNLVDTLSDLDLLDNEILYTTGGVLDNIAPPSASIIETFNNRIFLSGLEEENKIQYSKLRNPGTPVEFNDSLTINVVPDGGKITALAAMDDKLIIFKETAIFYITGDGPNNLGQQNNFIEPELITNDVGCIQTNSVVLMPEGLMFKSKKGIYTLGRSLSITYSGSPIEDFNDLTITSANLVPTKDIVIFLTNNQALVYNYFVRKWTTYTNHRGLSATSLDSLYYYVRNNNEVYVESNTYTDAGSFIKLKLETSWISFAGIQAYQRVYRLLVLGEYKSPHKAIIKAAYNFTDAFTQEKIIDTADFTSDNKYGETFIYGEQSPYGGNGNQYQYRLNLAKQKCQSIKVRIEDSESSSFGESLEISNILFVVGVKRGEFKVPQSTTYGTN